MNGLPNKLDVLQQRLNAIYLHPHWHQQYGQLPEAIYSTRIDLLSEVYYFNFIKPDTVPQGIVYRTWVVQVRAGEVHRVNYFRSRRGQSGDITLLSNYDLTDLG
jgi:hypothetical protein